MKRDGKPSRAVADYGYVVTYSPFTPYISHRSILLALANIIEYTDKTSNQIWQTLAHRLKLVSFSRVATCDLYRDGQYEWHTRRNLNLRTKIEKL